MRSKISAEELWHGKKNGWLPKHLKEFGRIGIVTILDKKVNKMQEKGKPMVMVGYAKESPAGTYRMWNHVTNRIVSTDSVKWSNFASWEIKEEEKLSKIFKAAKAANQAGLETFDEMEMEQAMNSQGIAQIEPVANAPENMEQVEQAEPAQPAPILRRSTRIAQLEETRAEWERAVMTDGTNKVTGNTTMTPIQLDEGHVIIEPENEGEEPESAGDTANSIFVFNTSLNSDPGEPVTFEQAMAGPKAKWWTASAISEVNNFLGRKTWTFAPKSDAKGRKLVGTKLVFKIKDEADGTLRYKTRIVTLGYMQIPGVDFTEKFSPVATDSSIRIVFALTLFYWDSKGWRNMGLDVEAAFLEGKQVEPMYLKCPKVLAALGFMTYEQLEEYCIRLDGGMYGNVDAALRFFIEFVKVLKKVGMKQCLADPCVFYMRDESDGPKLIAVMTVDDCLLAGKPVDMKWLQDEVAKYFKITREMVVKKHLGIDYEWKRDSKGEIYVQCTMEKKANAIVARLEAFLGRTIKEWRTPGAPSTVLDKNDGEVVHQSEYRSFTGQLMFFGVKIGPKTSNAIRDLARHLINPGESHWMALERVVGYIKGLELKGMNLTKPKDLRLVSMVDADFAKDPMTRRSVGGEIHTLGGCITAFGSRGEKTSSLSTSESEYKSLANGSKEQQFQLMLMREIAYVKLPGILFEDNTGTIFLVKNKQVGARTKHIDVQYHFVRSFCSEDEYGITRGSVEKVDTAENIADIFTKNTDVKTFEYHAMEIDGGFPKLKEKVFGEDGIANALPQTLFGGMSSGNELA